MQPWHSVLLISFTLIIFGAGLYYDQIKKKFDNGGVLVAPAASALANIETDNLYFSSLKKSNIIIIKLYFFVFFFFFLNFF